MSRGIITIFNHFSGKFSNSSSIFMFLEFSSVYFIHQYHKKTAFFTYKLIAWYHWFFCEQCGQNMNKYNEKHNISCLKGILIAFSNYTTFIFVEFSNIFHRFFFNLIMIYFWYVGNGFYKCLIIVGNMTYDNVHQINMFKWLQLLHKCFWPTNSPSDLLNLACLNNHFWLSITLHYFLTSECRPHSCFTDLWFGLVIWLRSGF